MNPVKEQRTYLPHQHVDSIDFLYSNQERAHIEPVPMEQAALAFGFNPDSPLLQAMGAQHMTWQHMMHADTCGEMYMAAPVKGEFDIQKALLIMAKPNDTKRLPGNRITGIIAHADGMKQVVGLDYDQSHGRLNRIVFSDPHKEGIFEPTLPGRSHLEAGIFTPAMINVIETGAKEDILDKFLLGDISTALTLEQLPNYEVVNHGEIWEVRNKTWGIAVPSAIATNALG